MQGQYFFCTGRQNVVHTLFTYEVRENEPLLTQTGEDELEEDDKDEPVEVGFNVRVVLILVEGNGEIGNCLGWVLGWLGESEADPQELVQYEKGRDAEEDVHQA